MRGEGAVELELVREALDLDLEPGARSWSPRQPELEPLTSCCTNRASLTRVRAEKVQAQGHKGRVVELQLARKARD